MLTASTNPSPLHPMKKHKPSPALVAFEQERLKSALITRTIILVAFVAVLSAIIVHQANN
jgi:hypothetical protein